MLKGLRYRLLISDPGFWRLKHTVRTMVALAATLLAFQWAGALAAVYAGLSDAVLVQATAGKTRRAQQATMILTAAGLTGLVGLGAALKVVPRLDYALIAVVAFFVMWIRRFIPGGGFFTVFGFLLFLLSTALPGYWATEMMAVAGGLPAAFIVRFIAWPDKPDAPFRDNVRLSIIEMCRAAGAMREGIEAGWPPRVARKLHKIAARLHDAAEFNAGLAAGLPRSRPEFDAALRDQFHAIQVTVMMRHSLEPLASTADLRTRARLSAALRPLESEEGGLPPPGAQLPEDVPPATCEGIRLAAAALWGERFADVRARLRRHRSALE